MNSSNQANHIRFGVRKVHLENRRVHLEKNEEFIWLDRHCSLLFFFNGKSLAIEMDILIFIINLKFMINSSSTKSRKFFRKNPKFALFLKIVLRSGVFRFFRTTRLRISRTLLYLCTHYFIFIHWLFALRVFFGPGYYSQESTTVILPE